MPKSNEPPSQVKFPKILAVEGEDERNFFDALLRNLRISDIDIRIVGGKDQFKSKLPALKNAPGFLHADGSYFVTHLGIVRDQEGQGANRAFQSVSGILQSADFNPPEKPGQFSDDHPKIGIFIMPGDTIKGTMLEDLCLETVKDRPAMRCVDEFSSCVAALESPPQNISKAKAQVFKAQVFLATQPKIVDSVGLGSQKGYWNFKSQCLAELKAFLSHLK